jgi:hypothetical protein
MRECRRLNDKTIRAARERMRRVVLAEERAKEPPPVQCHHGRQETSCAQCVWDKAQARGSVTGRDGQVLTRTKRVRE